PPWQICPVSSAPNPRAHPETPLIAKRCCPGEAFVQLAQLSGGCESGVQPLKRIVTVTPKPASRARWRLRDAARESSDAPGAWLGAGQPARGLGGLALPVQVVACQP